MGCLPVSNHLCSGPCLILPQERRGPYLSKAWAGARDRGPKVRSRPVLLPSITSAESTDHGSGKARGWWRVPWTSSPSKWSPSLSPRAHGARSGHIPASAGYGRPRSTFSRAWSRIVFQWLPTKTTLSLKPFLATWARFLSRDQNSTTSTFCGAMP